MSAETGWMQKIQEADGRLQMRARSSMERSEVVVLLERVLGEIGADRFSSMRLLALEKLVRSHDPSGSLPGKTVLREVIHDFRMKRWPGTAPKKAR